MDLNFENLNSSPFGSLPPSASSDLRRSHQSFKRHFVATGSAGYGQPELLKFSETLIRPPIGIYVAEDEGDLVISEDTTEGFSKTVDADGRIQVKIGGETLRKLHRPWSRALIVKVLGKDVEFGYFRDRLTAQWKLHRGFEITDIGNGHYCIRFYCHEDYNRVLLEGPWMISGCYLTVQKWYPHFDPFAAGVITTPVWIRLRGISLEYFDEDLLMSLGSLFGEAIKVDLITLAAARGKYARICVAVDLSKSLTPAVWVNGWKIQAEYEGLHQICFECGTFGHKQDRCPSTIQTQAREDCNTHKFHVWPDCRILVVPPPEE